MSPGPLDGIRVIEVASWMAAPSAAAALADLGADVVKIEPLTGDPARNMNRPGRPAGTDVSIDAAFVFDNRGKRSIAVAVDRPEGAELVRRLVARADVFLCNLLPRRQLRYGLDPATLHALQPRLVHASVSGYGTRGDDAERPGYDVTAFFGRGAVADTMTHPGQELSAPRPAQGDHTTALAIVASILAALRLVERTGEGQVVEASLLGTAAWTMATDLAPVLVDGREPTRRDRSHPLTALGNRFCCQDGRWLIMHMPEPRWWAPFCRAIGRGDLVDDPRFATVRARYDNSVALTAELDAAFAGRPLAEWSSLLDGGGFIWGPASTLVELAADPQAVAAGAFPTYEEESGPYRTIGLPFVIRDAAVGPRGRAPRVGEHTLEVLREVGCDDAAIGRLVADGVVGAEPES